MKQASIAIAALALSLAYVPASHAGIDLGVQKDFASADLFKSGRDDDDRGRGRGRGRGGDDDRGDRSDRDSRDRGASGSGRSKPRIPGGSGCDDPGDVAEHPECRGSTTGGSTGASGGPTLMDILFGSGSNRSRARIPGGSGCDDPGDIAEHPECRQ